MASNCFSFPYYSAYIRARNAATNADEEASAWKNLGITYEIKSNRAHLHQDRVEYMRWAVVATVRSLMAGEKANKSTNWMEYSCRLFEKHCDIYARKTGNDNRAILSSFNHEIHFRQYRHIAYLKRVNHCNHLMEQTLLHYGSMDFKAALTHLEVSSLQFDETV